MRKISILIILLCVSIVNSQTTDIDSLALQLAFQNEDSLKVDTSLKLIKSLYKIKDYDRASKYIIESEKLSNAINHKKGIAEITYYKALIYDEKGDYINAINGYTKSKMLFNDLKDALTIAKINNSIGLLEIKRGNYARGLRFSLNAIKELEQRNLKLDLKHAYVSLAKTYYSINAYDKAITFYLKAADVQEEINDTKGLNTSNYKLAELYSQNNEHRKAIQYYEKVLNNVVSKNDSVRGRVLPKLGGEYLKFNELDKATKYLIKGYNINRRTKDQEGLLSALNNLGDLNIRKNRESTAEKQLIEAGNIAENIGNKEELLKFYRLMKTLDSTKKRFDKAFVWQRQYYDLYNTLKKDKAENMATFDINQTEVIPLDDNFKKPPVDIIAQEKTLRKNTLENNKQVHKLKLIIYSLLSAFILVSIFLILIYLKRNNHLKHTEALQKINTKITLQNESYVEQTKYLENANNVKDKLFSIVSHDLKDSLSSINGLIDLVKDGTLSKEEFDNLIPELSENANNASLLVFNLLNWSKSQMHSLDPKPSLFSIQDVFEDKVKLIEPRMESKGITLIDDSLRDTVYADRSMFEIIIQNLLANALKFSKNGDTVTISNHISNGNCVISIKDTGIGISEQNVDKLFNNDSFSTSGTNNEKGTGLGLSICKELVELNNGKIWVKSTKSVGSTFYVELPKSK